MHGMATMVLHASTTQHRYMPLGAPLDCSAPCDFFFVVGLCCRALLLYTVFLFFNRSSDASELLALDCANFLILFFGTLQPLKSLQSATLQPLQHTLVIVELPSSPLRLFVDASSHEQERMCQLIISCRISNHSIASHEYISHPMSNPAGLPSVCSTSVP